jgi:hypothetical protein
VSAHDALLHQLVANVAERRRSGPLAAARDLQRWWRRRVGRAAAPVLAALAIVALAVLIPQAADTGGRARSAAVASASIEVTPCNGCTAFADRLGGAANVPHARTSEAAQRAGVLHFRRWNSSPEIRPPGSEAGVG